MRQLLRRLGLRLRVCLRLGLGFGLRLWLFSLLLFALFRRRLLLLCLFLLGLLRLLRLCWRRNELDVDGLLLRRRRQLEGQVVQKKKGYDEVQGDRHRRAPSHPFPPISRKKLHRQGDKPIDGRNLGASADLNKRLSLHMQPEIRAAICGPSIEGG
ncbi:hypothetical protein ACI2KT_28665 [Ensifer adhaerens]|uniref:hypothetical protein n=1 Tax=Ensifer adhaerens TaxID=106592 RepID=UPI003850472D